MVTGLRGCTLSRTRSLCAQGSLGRAIRDTQQLAQILVQQKDCEECVEYGAVRHQPELTGS